MLKTAFARFFGVTVSHNNNLIFSRQQVLFCSARCYSEKQRGCKGLWRQVLANLRLQRVFLSWRSVSGINSCRFSASVYVLTVAYPDIFYLLDPDESPRDVRDNWTCGLLAVRWQRLSLSHYLAMLLLWELRCCIWEWRHIKFRSSRNVSRNTEFTWQMFKTDPGTGYLLELNSATGTIPSETQTMSC